MAEKVNYTFVGGFVIVLTIALVSISAWLVTRMGGQNFNTYLIFIKTDVTGLTEDSPVRYNGVKVGYVSSIELDKTNLQRVKIKIRVKSTTPVNTSTVATAMPQGITGILYISLQSNKPHAPPLKARPSEKYPIIPSEPSVFSQIGKVVPKIAKKLENFMSDFQKVIDKDNVQHFKNILANSDQITSNLARESKRFNSIMNRVDRITKQLDDASEKLPQITNDFQKTLHEFKDSAKKVQKASQSVENIMAHSQQSIDQISDQVIPEFHELVKVLINSATKFNDLMNQLNRNPSLLIRGKQSQMPGPGER